MTARPSPVVHRFFQDVGEVVMIRFVQRARGQSILSSSFYGSKSLLMEWSISSAKRACRFRKREKLFLISRLALAAEKENERNKV